MHSITGNHYRVMKSLARRGFYYFYIFKTFSTSLELQLLSDSTDPISYFFYVTHDLDSQLSRNDLNMGLGSTLWWFHTMQPFSTRCQGTKLSWVWYAGICSGTGGHAIENIHSIQIPGNVILLLIITVIRVSLIILHILWHVSSHGIGNAPTPWKWLCFEYRWMPSGSFAAFINHEKSIRKIHSHT